MSVNNLCQVRVDNNVCGETENLTLIEELKNVYQQRMEDINARNKDGICTEFKTQTLEAMVRDLGELNTMLVDTVNQMESEAVRYVELLEKHLIKSSQTAEKLMNQLQNLNSRTRETTRGLRRSREEQLSARSRLEGAAGLNELQLQEIASLKNDRKNLIKLIRRIREENSWNADDLEFRTVSLVEILGTDIPVYEETFDAEIQTSYAELFPTVSGGSDLKVSSQYSFHKNDVSPVLEQREVVSRKNSREQSVLTELSTSNFETPYRTPVRGSEVHADMETQVNLSSPLVSAQVCKTEHLSHPQVCHSETQTQSSLTRQEQIPASQDLSQDQVHHIGVQSEGLSQSQLHDVGVQSQVPYPNDMPHQNSTEGMSPSFLLEQNMSSEIPLRYYSPRNGSPTMSRDQATITSPKISAQIPPAYSENTVPGLSQSQGNNIRRSKTLYQTVTVPRLVSQEESSQTSQFYVEPSRRTTFPQVSPPSQQHRLIETARTQTVPQTTVPSQIYITGSPQTTLQRVQSRDSQDSQQTQKFNYTQNSTQTPIHSQETQQTQTYFSPRISIQIPQQTQTYFPTEISTQTSEYRRDSQEPQHAQVQYNGLLKTSQENQYQDPIHYYMEVPRVILSPKSAPKSHFIEMSPSNLHELRPQTEVFPSPHGDVSASHIRSPHHIATQNMVSGRKGDIRECNSAPPYFKFCVELRDPCEDVVSLPYGENTLSRSMFYETYRWTLNPGCDYNYN